MILCFYWDDCSTVGYSLSLDKFIKWRYNLQGVGNRPTLPVLFEQMTYWILAILFNVVVDIQLMIVLFLLRTIY